VFNSDSRFYGGTDLGNGAARLPRSPSVRHGRGHSLALTLPPLGALVLEPL